ncbi:MAG: peroxiredoxin family protein [Thermodesulfobacteriota bacterium]
MVYKHKVVLSLFAFLSFLILPVKDSLASNDHWGRMGVIKMVNDAPAPDFVLSTPDNRLIELTEFRGKVVFINFWASWCKPCRDEMPSMERLYKRYKDKGLVILAVNIMEDTDTVKGFMDELGLTFTPLMDRKGEVKQLYNVYTIPTSYLLDKTGVIRGKAIGDRDWSYPAAFRVIEEMLEE